MPVNAGDGLYVTVPNTYGQYVLTDEDADINTPESVTIPANGTKEITVSVDVSNLPEEIRSIYSNGFFVDWFRSIN